MIFLGFSAGLPYLLVFSTLSAWLADEKISRSMIGLFSWIGITYSIKFFWAPVVDRARLPILTRLFGQRRSWMILAQLGIAIGLLGMSFANPATDLVFIAWFALLVAFSSATQDITIDAYRIEAIDTRKQAAMAATYILGYRIALLVAGAGAFYLAEYLSWSMAYMVMAALMGVGLLTALIIKEPTHETSQADIMLEQRVLDFMANSHHWPQRTRNAMAWFIGAVVCPFVDFFKRNGTLALVILLFVGVFRLSDITMGVMANPFYLDMGFSKPEIANIAKIFGFFMTIGGAALGGLLVVRYGIFRPLLLGAVMVALTNLLFAYMATGGPDITLLALVISADNLSGGLSNAVFIAYLSSLTNKHYTATQYALFSSLMTLPGKFIGGFSGVVVDSFGYVDFFIYAAVMGVPAIVLALYLMKQSPLTQKQ
ncbi:MAG: AmpG family muropeptide MFS transporter [Proteobacteria bacterium]|nr:AmpG family muropeptide MFS transporter [Pseudomonadota bacterium]